METATTIFTFALLCFLFIWWGNKKSKTIQNEIMKPKEKAKELISKFMFAGIYFTDGESGAKLNAKFCAILAVDEILNQNNETVDFEYWAEVKQEIED